jgi:hypothetical protein
MSRRKERRRGGREEKERRNMSIYDQDTPYLYETESDLERGLYYYVHYGDDEHNKIRMYRILLASTMVSCIVSVVLVAIYFDEHAISLFVPLLILSVVSTVVCGLLVIQVFCFVE